jgi:tripartite-type tricarboxylate transporter receptor subunit TctC
MKQISTIAALSALLLAALQLPHTAAAQSYPSKPIRLVVNSGPGGPSDLIARGFSQLMPQTLGQSVVVENRIGAAGIIGADAVAKSAPDGYTVLITVSSPITLNPYFYTKLPYDPHKDFTPLSLLSVINAAFFAHPTLPANNMTELIALARAKPDEVLFGSWGIGSFPDLYRAWMENKFNVRFRHIPYKEANQVAAALLSGEVQVLQNPVGALAPQVRSGKLKGLGTLGEKRVAALPDLPSFAEMGLDLNFLGWVGAFGPANMPRDVSQRLNTEMHRLVNDNDYAAKFLRTQSMEGRGGSIESFQAFLKTDHETAGRLAKLAGVKPE